MPIYYFDHVKGYKIKDFPNSREYYNNTISLPIYYELKNKHLNKVFNTVVNFLKNKNFKKF